jgi:aminopeptidase N
MLRILKTALFTKSNQLIRQCSTIPAHLQHVKEAKDPKFTDMIEYYYHSAGNIARPHLLELMQEQYPYKTKEKLASRIDDIMKVLSTTAASIEVCFPVKMVRCMA